MPLFIQAYEKYGWLDVLPFPIDWASLRQTAETVAWLIARLGENCPIPKRIAHWKAKNSFLVGAR